MFAWAEEKSDWWIFPDFLPLHVIKFIFNWLWFNPGKVAVIAFKWSFLCCVFSNYWTLGESVFFVNLCLQNIHHQITCLNLCEFTLVTLSLQSGDRCPGNLGSRAQGRGPDRQGPNRLKQSWSSWLSWSSESSWSPWSAGQRVQQGHTG